MPEGDRYVTNGALLRCDKGVLITPLTVLPRPSRVNGQFQANALDCLPVVNIKPFGVCAITRAPCMPVMPFWTQVHAGALKVGGAPPLLESSVCQCGLGGRIGITVLPVPGAPPVGPEGAGGLAALQEQQRQQDAAAHALANHAKEQAGKLALLGLACAIGGLFFPPLEIVAVVALEASEAYLVAGIAIDVAVAIDHPTQDNWVTVGGDVVAVALGYVVGKVVVGRVMTALARRYGPAAGKEVAAETAAVAEAPPASPPLKAQSYEELGQKPPCFLAGTLVKTPAGDRPIELLVPGEMVLAYDFATAQLVAQPIVGTMRNWTRFVVALTLGGEVVRSTREHRFWSPTTHTWVAAAELMPGTAVLTADGRPAAVEHHRVYEAEAETYNFEVAELHNYFVGMCGTLVHNAKQPPKVKPPSKYTYTTRTPTRIYEVYDPKTGKVIYVGKTEQTLADRMAQHQKSANKAHWEPNKYKIRGVREGNWTEYETAAWEHHHIEKNGGKANLENRQVGIDKAKYYKYGQPQYGHNPCP